MATQKGFSDCRHTWQYADGVIDGDGGKDNVVVIRCCANCGRREMASTKPFALAKGDYALDEHYQGLTGAA